MICTTRCFKPDPASNEAFLEGSVKQDASNQLQLQMKPFLKGFVKQNASNQIQPQMKTFFKELLNKMLQPSSSLKWSFSLRICKRRSFKPDPASNEAFLKGPVKQDASNQLQPQMKPFSKDLESNMLQTRSSFKWIPSWKQNIGFTI